MFGVRPGWEWLLVLLVVVVLFGAKRLPDTARALGRSMRILKSEVKGMKDDDEAAQTSPTQRTSTTAAVEGPAEPPPASGPVPAAQPAPPAAEQPRQP